MSDPRFPRPFPFASLDGSSTRPFGMPMCQNRLAVPTWSYAMEMLPPARVIEIGSYNGAFATALGLHAKMIGAKMITYDINKPAEEIVPVGRALGVDFRVCNVFENISELVNLIGGKGVTFLLCDGGDKRRELATFAPYMKPGDVIAVHDYDAAHEVDPAIPAEDRPWPWSEITRAHAEPVRIRDDLTPWMQDHFDLAGWLVFRKSAS